MEFPASDGRQTPRPTRRRSSGEIHTRANAAVRDEAAPKRARDPRKTSRRDKPAAAAAAASTAASRATASSAGAANTGAPDGRSKPPHPKSRPQDDARALRDTPPRKRRTAPEPDVPPVDPPSGTGRGSASGSGRFGARFWGRGVVAVVSVAVLVCTGFAWHGMTGLTSTITQLAGLGLGGADDGAVDILLVGTDSRTDAKGNPLSEKELRMLRSGDEVATNTDTILLMRIPNDGSSATAISIPRDSYVDVPGIGKSKINAAYGTTREGVRRRAVEAGKSEAEAEKEGTQAGRKALIDTVAGLTGVKVDHYAEVGLLGFVLLTKAVGGVEVCLKNPVREPFSGANFRAGRQTLSGPQALSFVRQRHELPRGDLDRITRQQVFMASLTQKVLSANTLTDPGKLNELESAVARSVVIDDNWDVLSFVEQLKDLSGGRVKFATIPVVDDQGWSDDGQQSVVTVDPTKVRAFTSALLDKSGDGQSAQRGDFTVDVDNAGTIDGLAGNVSTILASKGYQAGATSSHPQNTRDSVVYARTADDPGARMVAKDLGGVQVKADPKLDENRLRLVLTNTYDGIGSITNPGAGTGGTPAPAKPVGSSRAPITAGSDGPTCVN
ncbi:phosphotransferase Lcp1 [Gordonia sinesedis]